MNVVDLKTAMTAASGDARRKSRGNSTEREKSKSLDPDKILEPFDPAKHLEKERADLASMWLILTYAVFIALVSRYLLLPSFESADVDILWVGPLLLIFTIAPLHRAVLSSNAEHYNGGTWFKASFLYVFTWLAVGFLLTNPPFGDTAPPQAREWSVVVLSDDWNRTEPNSTYEAILDTGDMHADLTISPSSNRTNGTVFILVEVHENGPIDHVTANATVTHISSTVWVETVPTSFDDGLLLAVDDVTSQHAAMTDKLPNSLVLAVDLGHLELGTHEVVITLSDQGNPKMNTTELEITIRVSNNTA